MPSLIFATIIWVWMCDAHPRAYDGEPVIAQRADCSFENAAEDQSRWFPVHGGPVYPMEHGLIGQTIEQYTGCGWRKSTLIVDCEAHRSMLLFNREQIKLHEAGEIDADGPRLPPFLVRDGLVTVDAIAARFNGKWDGFDNYLVGLNGGDGPSAYCGCFLEDPLDEKDQ